MHLVLCFTVWTLVFTCLFWRSLTITKQAIGHLQRLHQVPCNQCTYFTGDYRLKCTVNPVMAMSEDAIGCRDYEPCDCSLSICSNCSNSKPQAKYPVPKRTFLSLK